MKGGLGGGEGESDLGGGRKCSRFIPHLIPDMFATVSETALLWVRIVLVRSEHPRSRLDCSFWRVKPSVRKHIH